MKTWHFAIATTVATFVLLLVGGTVNPTGSSLACPDWPTCYGSFVPEMKGGIFFEHGHRLVATLVGAMTVGLAVLLWIHHRNDPRLRALGLLAAVLVVAQGVLGGMTVLLRLPPLVSTAHLALAIGFFGLLIYLCFRSRPGRPEAAAATSARRKLAWCFGITAAVVYAQILLGAFVRHQDAGVACLDIPFCGGAVWPALWPQQLHMLHRAGSISVLAAVVVSSSVCLRISGSGALTRWMAYLAPALVLVQVAVGVWTVLSGIYWVPAMLHLGLAAALFATQLIGAFSVLDLPSFVENEYVGTEQPGVAVLELGEGVVR